MSRYLTPCLIVLALACAGCSSDPAPSTSGGWTGTSITGAPRAPGTAYVSAPMTPAAPSTGTWDAPMPAPPPPPAAESGWSAPATPAPAPEAGAGASCGAGGQACG